MFAIYICFLVSTSYQFPFKSFCYFAVVLCVATVSLSVTQISRIPSYFTIGCVYALCHRYLLNYFLHANLEMVLFPIGNIASAYDQLGQRIKCISIYCQSGRIFFFNISILKKYFNNSPTQYLVLYKVRP